MSDPVDRLRQVGDNATEGEWTAKPHGSALHSTWHVDPVADMWGLEGDPDDREQEQANAEFIATARNVWDPLLDVARVARAIEANDWETLVAIGGPVRHRADDYAFAEDFATEGDYEADARYIHPAREKAREQALRAALDRLNGETP